MRRYGRNIRLLHEELRKGQGNISQALFHSGNVKINGREVVLRKTITRTFESTTSTYNHKGVEVRGACLKNSKKS